MLYAMRKCEVCGKPYEPLWSGQKNCSQRCRGLNPDFRKRMSLIMSAKGKDPSHREMLVRTHSHMKGKSLEEFYGVERAKEIRLKLRKSAIEINSRIKDKQRDGYNRHKNNILKTLKEYEGKGYLCAPVSNEFPRPDIVAFKDGKVYGIEVERFKEGVRLSKYKEHPYYTDIIWVVYEKDTSKLEP